MNLENKAGIVTEPGAASVAGSRCSWPVRLPASSSTTCRPQRRGQDRVPGRRGGGRNRQSRRRGARQLE
jgi:hypothetical protein